MQFELPLVRQLSPNSGILGPYNLNDQMRIIENYFAGLKGSFKKAHKKNLFFKTLGFGAVWRAFPVVFSTTMKNSQGGFQVSDVKSTLSGISTFDFDSWSNLGTGSGAEKQAGDDLITELQSANDIDSNDGSSIRL